MKSSLFEVFFVILGIKQSVMGYLIIIVFFVLLLALLIFKLFFFCKHGGLNKVAEIVKSSSYVGYGDYKSVGSPGLCGAEYDAARSGKYCHGCCSIKRGDAFEESHKDYRVSCFICRIVAEHRGECPEACGKEYLRVYCKWSECRHNKP